MCSHDKNPKGQAHGGSRENKGCREYGQLSRRHFMGGLGGLIAAAAVPAWVPRVVLAQSEVSERDVIVSIFLRGGLDGLTVCPPYGDPAYLGLRPNLGILPPDASGENRAIELDGFFGLAPAMQPLVEAYEDGDLLLVHACGLSNAATRSHFEAMSNMETGQNKAPAELFNGWLGRHLQMTAPTLESAVLRAVGIGAGLPLTLVGGPKSLPIADLGSFGLPGFEETEAERRAAMETMYRFAESEALKTSAEGTFQTVDLLEQIDFDGYQPTGGAEYPQGEFGLSLRSAAALIKAEVGVEAVAIDLGGWDTHENQGPVGGEMAFLMGQLAAGLAAFHQDLQSGPARNVTLVAMSEFGRNAFENGSSGTDHGHGGLMFALGPGMRGGQVLSEWPGLAPEQLFEDQDLAITIDYRDILAEILDKRLGNGDAAALFPDPEYVPRQHGIVV